MEKTTVESGSIQKKRARPFFNGVVLQPKLTVNAPGDRHEREADAVAERVMRMPLPLTPVIHRKCKECEEERLQRKPVDDDVTPVVQRKADGSDRLVNVQESSTTLLEGKAVPTNHSYAVQRKCAECEEEDESPVEAAFDAHEEKNETEDHSNLLQRKCDECTISKPTAEELEEEKEPEEEEEKVSRKTFAAGGAGEVPAPEGMVTALGESKGNGTAMQNEVASDMEARFAQDFSDVRIHTGSKAARLSSSINAQAFTHGKDIYFNANKYAPASYTGQKLLAHELTHVVQQTGSTPIQPKLQRAPLLDEPKLGNWAHSHIQHRLRQKDKKLITEAGIPGGTRDKKAHNVVGFADLYKADGNVVSGVRAIIKGAAGDVEDVTYTYQNMLVSGKRKKNIKSRSKVNFGPRINKDKTWDFTHNFPANFEIGELKPLFPTEFKQSLAYHGLGTMQIGNYKEGFKEFVERGHKDVGQQIPSSITGKSIDLPDSKIPDSINYSKFEQKHSTTDKEAIHKKDTKQRVWIYRLKNGLIVYFLVPHPYTSKDFPKRADEQLKKLDPLLKELRKKRPKMGSSLDTKRMSRSGTVQQPEPYKISRVKKKRVQAKKGKWDKTAKKWEEKRKNWVRGKDKSVKKPKSFLKEEAKGVVKKSKVDKKLGLTPSGKLAKQARKVKNIKFWSSYKGRILGALRFRFGKVFDKLKERFDNIKKRFQRHRKSAAKLNNKKGIFGGWKKKATRIIIRFAVEILKDMLGMAYKGFIKCINGIIGAILSKYSHAVDETKEEVVKEIEPVCCEVMVFYTKLKTEYDKHEKEITRFTDDIKTLKQWAGILSDVVTAIRVGVQIISCGAPPGLGCLWGLVAQIGISAGLNLLTRTDYFKDEIAKPAASKLMDAIVGDKLHNFMIDLLEGTPLKPYMEEAKTCHRVKRGMGNAVIGKNLGKLDPNDPANAKARKEWESEYKHQILKDLQTVFEGEKGKKVTEEDLQKLVKAIQNSKKTPKEIKALIEASRNTGSGKLNLAEALTYVNKGAAPKRQTPKRNFDKNKAKKNNTLYQEWMKWSPLLFYKKPGVKADSDEFAEFIYDMQKTLGIKNPDGMAGPKTVVKYYKKHKLRKDGVFKRAERLILKDKAAKILAKKYPPLSQLKADLSAVNWDKTSPGKYVIGIIDDRQILYGKTSNGARVGAYYKTMETIYKGKIHDKIIHTSKFYNLNPIDSGDMVGLILVDLNDNKRTVLGSIILTADDKPIPAGSTLDIGDGFIGLLLEEVGKKK